MEEDFTPTPSTPESSGSLSKIIVTVMVLGVLGVAGYKFGPGLIKGKLSGLSSSATKDPETIEKWMEEEGFPTIGLPQDYLYVAAFKEVYENANMKMFVAAAGSDGSRDWKTSTEALDLAQFTRPVYFFVVPKGGGASSSHIQTLLSKIEEGSPMALIQNKIWISGQETPAFIGSYTKSGKQIVNLLVGIPKGGLLLASSSKDAYDSAPHRDMIASAYQIKTEDVTIKSPESSAAGVAKQILTASPLDRKNLVTNLVALQEPKQEAVSILAAALPTAAKDVKADIVSALGLMAKTTPEALPPLLSALDDKTARLEAITALGSLGSQAEVAVPKLKKIAANKKEKPQIKTAAKKALHQIQPAVPAAAKKGKKPTHRRKK